MLAILRTNIENFAFKHLISDYQFENLISRLSSLKIDMKRNIITEIALSQTYLSFFIMNIFDIKY